MSRLEVRKKSKAQLVVDNLYEDLERRIIASPPGLCPVDMTASFLKLFHAQTCGKCVPCRIGLGVLEDMLEDVLDGKATLETLSLIERTAKAIYDSAEDVYKRQDNGCETSSTFFLSFSVVSTV